jgi:hypothetical protein
VYIYAHHCIDARIRSFVASCRAISEELPMSQEPQSVNRARASLRAVRELGVFDYDAPAELYPSRSRRMRGPVAYKRFDTAAEAIRYAVEDLPESGLNGATMEVKEVRFGRDEILHLYAHASFPLERRKQAM